MDPKTDDADRRKILTLKKSSFEYNAFIFDVTLDLSYDMDSKWKNHKNVLLIILTTIIDQIGHKYEQWKSSTSIIVCSLLKKFFEIKPSCQWKGTLSACGQYVNENSAVVYSEIIYDWFTHDGFMTLPDDLGEPPISLQYTVRFLLSPALPIAQQIYSARGYELKYDEHEDFWIPYDEIMNTIIDHKKEYNHLEMWRAYYNAYSKNQVNTLTFSRDYAIFVTFGST